MNETGQPEVNLFDSDSHHGTDCCDGRHVFIVAMALMDKAFDGPLRIPFVVMAVLEKCFRDGRHGEMFSRWPSWQNVFATAVMEMF